MVVNRIAVAAIAAIVLFACSGPDERDIQQQLKIAGCALPESQYQQLPDRVVLSISVMGCSVSDGGGSRQLTSAAAITAVARTVWSVPTYRFDSLFVMDSSGASVGGGGDSLSSAEIPRDVLASRFGHRDPGMDTTPSPSLFADRGAAMSWMVIPPLAAIFGLVLFIALVRAIRRGSISVMWIIR